MANLMLYQKPKRDWRKTFHSAKRGFKTHLGKHGLAYSVGAGIATTQLAGMAYYHTRSPSKRREIDRKVEADKRKGQMSYANQAGLYGSIGFLGATVGVPSAYTAYHSYRDSRGGKRVKQSDYWKKNPEAYRFYKYKQAKGDTQAVNKLLRKAGISNKPVKRVSHFKTLNKAKKIQAEAFEEWGRDYIKNIPKRDLKKFKEFVYKRKYFTFDEIFNRLLNKRLTTNERMFTSNYGRIFRSKGYKRAVAGATLAGIGYGIHRAKKYRRKYGRA